MILNAVAPPIKYSPFLFLKYKKRCYIQALFYMDFTISGQKKSNVKETHAKRQITKDVKCEKVK